MKQHPIPAYATTEDTDHHTGANHAAAIHNARYAWQFYRLNSLIAAAKRHQAQRRYRRGLITFAIAFLGLLFSTLMLFRAVFP